jgi:hypothetical protein
MMFTCETCGKEWPENYCPDCGRTIGSAARRVAPPPLPAASLVPPPIPPLDSLRPAKKPFPRSALIALAALAAILVGGGVAYHLFQSFSFPPGYRNQPTASWGVRMGEKEFGNANAQIDAFQGVDAFGNSPEAVQLAHRFSEALKAGRMHLFTPGFKLEILDHTKGEFLTYCELHANECAFLVHVPQMREYNETLFEKVDARKLLAQLSWITALGVLKDQGAGKPQMELAVGLRGISQYGPITLGYYDEKAKAPEDGLVKYLDDGAQTHFLWTFFAPEGEPRAH